MIFWGYRPSMATIRERARKDGGITYTVLWHGDGGARGGKQDSEIFQDPTKAEAFKNLVDLAGQHWPEGWVRGKGFVEAKPDEIEDRPLDAWGARVIDRLNGIEKRTRADYHRDMRLHVNGVLVHTLPDGTVEPATVANITEDDLADWVRAEEEGLPNPDKPEKWLRRPAAPKSIANRHGMLWSIFQAAVEAKPAPLRQDNPCKGTTLPRQDDGTQEEMVFLERPEWQRVRAELALICGGDAVDLGDLLIATGLRWGEATALFPGDINLTTKRLTVQRAWRRQDDGSFKLGPPKTKKARRSIVLDPATLAMARRLMAGKDKDTHLFLTASGNPWRHSNFRYRRWVPALKAAQAKGLTKTPRIHDLRHTHVSWLIAARIPLPAIQSRLGHESITTTVDRYGHLVQELDAEISAALEAALTTPAPTTLRLAAPMASAG